MHCAKCYFHPSTLLVSVGISDKCYCYCSKQHRKFPHFTTRKRSIDLNDPFSTTWITESTKHHKCNLDWIELDSSTFSKCWWITCNRLSSFHLYRYRILLNSRNRHHNNIIYRDRFDTRNNLQLQSRVS